MQPTHKFSLAEHGRLIILASQSPQRQKLLATLPISFRSQPANIDEAAIQDADPVVRARLVAEAKLTAVHKHHPLAVLLAADTFVVLDGKTLEKPQNLTEAAQMLTALSGQEALAVTGFAYQDDLNEISYRGSVTTRFGFRELSDSEIFQFVEHNPVTTWSASFSPAYDQGIALVSWIDGSFTSFTHGLPLELVVPLMQQSGIAV